MLAQEESRRLGHNFVGTEQLLLGLIHEGTGIAAKALKSMGINLKDTRVQVEKIIGRGSGFVTVEIPFTPRAKRVLELSWDEARQLGHNYIATEHLLLGIIREGEGVAHEVLKILAVDLDKLRIQVISLIEKSGAISSDQALKLRTFPFESKGEMPPLDKLSDSVLRAIVFAREETRRLGHKEVLPEMIFLGLIAEENSLAARSMKEGGVTLETARADVEKAIGRGSGLIPVNSPFSEQTRELLKMAWDTTRGFSQDTLTSEHMLFALLRLDGRKGEGALRKYGTGAAKLMFNLTKEFRKAPMGLTTVTELTDPDSSQETLPDPLSRFTQKAVEVMMFAQEESRLLGHNFVGTETILLGLLRENTGIGGIALKSQGVNLEKARIEVEKIIGRGSGFVAVEIPFTPRAKRSIGYAWDEARFLGHTSIGTEHLLLGLLREGEGVAARVLEILGVSNADLRKKILEQLKEGGAATA